MNNLIKKIALILVFILILVPSQMAFTKSRSIGTIDRSLSDQELYQNQTNGVLLHYIRLMTDEDMYVCEQSLKKYKEGYTSEAWDEMTQMLSYYTKSPAYVAYYILIEPTAVPYAMYHITTNLNLYNSSEDDIFGEPITMRDEDNLKRIWNYFLSIYNAEELSHFSIISFTKRTDLENGISISPIDDDFDKWMIDVSINLLKNPDLLFKTVAGSLVYYHALRKENLEKSSLPSTNTYMAYNRRYRQDSAINQFYRLYWKKIRIEYDQSSIKDYKKDFISAKASRTCHDDFVESFFNYMQKGVISDDENNSIVSQKTNFFDKYAEYKLLADRLRIVFGF